jgi:hypothetical protein
VDKFAKRALGLGHGRGFFAPRLPLLAVCKVFHEGLAEPYGRQRARGNPLDPVKAPLQESALLHPEAISQIHEAILLLLPALQHLTGLQIGPHHTKRCANGDKTYGNKQGDLKNLQPMKATGDGPPCQSVARPLAASVTFTLLQHPNIMPFMSKNASNNCLVRRSGKPPLG